LNGVRPLQRCRVPLVGRTPRAPEASRQAREWVIRQQATTPDLFDLNPADFVTGQVLYVDGGITASQ
jgi:hypothetical protein